MCWAPGSGTRGREEGTGRFAFCSAAFPCRVKVVEIELLGGRPLTCGLQFLSPKLLERPLAS